MRKVLAVLILLFCFNSTNAGNCQKQIKLFYATYFNNILQDDSKNGHLCKTYLTEELIEKVERLVYATGADPIIRAQDANEDAVETLSVENLTDNWYIVKYYWKKGDANSIVEIPLKAQEINGLCKITYITPIWNGSQYGDELLACKAEKVKEIDHTSALSFLKSFYDTYLYEYCNMPKDLSSKLASLRLDNLSQKALEEFENTELEKQKDGVRGYDMLIDNFDFDCLWCKSIKFEHLEGDNYQFSYKYGGKIYKVVTTVKKEGNRYLIGGFH